MYVKILLIRTLVMNTQYQDIIIHHFHSSGSDSKLQAGRSRIRFTNDLIFWTRYEPGVRFIL
jgi:hypothetical protein